MRAALYAGGSTLNCQNPEVRLAELREYSTRRGQTVTGEYLGEGVRLEGALAGPEPSHGRRSPAVFHSLAHVED
jgi:hypothetical protein